MTKSELLRRDFVKASILLVTINLQMLLLNRELEISEGLAKYLLDISTDIFVKTHCVTIIE